LILLDNGKFILSYYIHYSVMAEYIEVVGKIISVLPGTMFRVELPNKHVVLAHISGKLRKNFIKLMIGDTVKMEMSPQDLQKARIIFRMKNVEVQRNAPIRSFGPNRRR
jgi:translation initiation factor IF-1